MSGRASGYTTAETKRQPAKPNHPPTERRYTMNATKTTTTNATRPNFEQVKRNYETALASGKDTGTELTALATAVAYSVLNKCIDPQRKTAQTKAADGEQTASNSGHNPALVALKRGIAQDLATLENTRYCSERATRTTYNADGDTVTEIADKDAYNALTALAADTLTDGIDLVQTAALAILEQAADHADSGTEWLDTPYTVRRLSKRVYIQRTDSAAYKDTETTPIQEVYRAVRKAVQDSRAMQTDPRNGYSYIEDLTADGLDTIYYRLGKYTDLGGFDCNGNYTTGAGTVEQYETLVARMELTDRQAQILKLRMQGKGYKAIATYLGVSNNAIVKTVKQIQTKATAAGLTANGYNPQD